MCGPWGWDGGSTESSVTSTGLRPTLCTAGRELLPPPPEASRGKEPPAAVGAKGQDEGAGADGEENRHRGGAVTVAAGGPGQRVRQGQAGRAGRAWGAPEARRGMGTDA